MEMKQPKPLIKDYASVMWHRVCIVAVVIGVAATALSTLLISFITPPLMFAHLALTGGVGVAILLSIIGGAYIVLRPLRTIMHAIAHTNGEQLAVTIPNPHDKKYETTGLGTAIQAVYTKEQPISSVVTSTNPTIATTSINRMHGAIMTLDENRAVVYASGKAPTYTVNGILRPQLLFNGSDSLDEWLDECAETAVKAERLWQRVPDKPADTKGQRIFDVYASYEKGAAHETVLTVVDMTSRYQEDEDNLNFIAFAAHELRGPITVIRGYVDVLQDELDETLESDQRELFRRLSVSANRLSSYVNNILNTSRYDRRHLNLNLTPNQLASIYATISDDMNLRAASQNRLLSISIPTDLPEIAADRASLSEVISNLIDNAIKYSHEGGTVTVTAAQQGDFVDITIEDQGIGMASDVVKNLFQKFYRSHRSRETVAGSGIGLYISKAIVESHGGAISVRSTEGYGSTFTVSIPTYASVESKLSVDGGNQNLISQGKGWIKNHSMYRG